MKLIDGEKFCYTSPTLMQCTCVTNRQTYRQTIVNTTTTTTTVLRSLHSRHSQSKTAVSVAAISAFGLQRILQFSTKVLHASFAYPQLTPKQSQQGKHRYHTSPALCNPTGPFAVYSHRPHCLRPGIFRILLAHWHTNK